MGLDCLLRLIASTVPCGSDEWRAGVEEMVGQCKFLYSFIVPPHLITRGALFMGE